VSGRSHDVDELTKTRIPRALELPDAPVADDLAVEGSIQLRSDTLAARDPNRCCQEAWRTMRPEAEKILAVFKARRLSSGAQIPQSDFGDAIVWEGGFIRDDVVREALTELVENGYLIASSAAFELTEKGALFVYGSGEVG
jgi:hypothetical protein